jgi:glutamate dehydrogenase
VALHRETAGAARRTIDDIESSGGPWTFAKLTIANAALRELAGEGAKKKR